jgi:glycosyltransferase involved in cell wall biosynthesis
VPELVRKSDLLVLPSIEEGFGLVITEAMGSGCVPLASEACTEICSHMKTGLVHRVGDVDALTQHITMLHQDRTLLERLRAAGLEAATGVTWSGAGRILLEAYRETITAYRPEVSEESIRDQGAVCFHV